MHTLIDARNCTPLNLGALHIKCSPQQSLNNSLRRVNFQFYFFAARRLIVQDINAEAEERLYTDVTIKKMNVNSTTVERLRQCAIFEVIAENLYRAFLALIAGECLFTLRDSQHARIAAVGAALSELYKAALIAVDLDALELNVRTLPGDSTAVIVHRFKCYSLPAARDIGEMVIARYEERAFNSRPAVKYSCVNDASFPTCAVRVPRFHLPPGARLPHLRTTLSTSLLPPELSLLLTPGTQAQFSGSRRTSVSQQQSPVLFGRLSQLTPHSDAAVAARAYSLSQSQSQPNSQSSCTPAAFSSSAPAEIAASAFDWSSTGISRHALLCKSHGCPTPQSRSRSNRHAGVKTSAPSTITHARRVGGALLAVTSAAAAAFERSNCLTADRGDSAEHSSPAFARCLA